MNHIKQLIMESASNLQEIMDASEQKNFFLGLVFYKYLSDSVLEEVVIFKNTSFEDYDTQEKKTLLYVELLSDEEIKNDLVETLVKTLGYEIKPTYLFNVLSDQAQQNTFQLNDLAKAFNDLSTKYIQFNGLFDDIDLQSKKLGTDNQQRNNTIIKVLKKLNGVKLLGQEKGAIGDIYEYLISQFALQAGKKAGEFYTPREVSDLIARIVTIDHEENKFFSVFDPTMGSGSLMVNVRDYLKYPETIKYNGQELNTTTFNLAKMNLILHGVKSEGMRLRNGDTLSKDWPTDAPSTFDAVLMNPPFSAHWSADPIFLEDARFKRYEKLAPKSKADFSFLLHGFYHLKDTGTMAIVLPHGVLFRGAAEGIIRKKLLEDGSIDAVIGLPGNMFLGTSIPSAILILKKNRNTRDVLFIDASKDFVKEKKQNKLSTKHIDQIIETYKNRKTVSNYSHLSTFEEIASNDYNLNIPRYISALDNEEQIDIQMLGDEIFDLNLQIKKKEAEFLAFLEDIAITDETKALIETTKRIFK